MNEMQEDLRDALRRMYEMDFTYLETVYLAGVSRAVEVFAIHGHPRAVLAYGWSLEKEEEVQYFSFLPQCSA